MRAVKPCMICVAAAMAMHVAEAANVHQEVEAQRRAGVESAKRLIVPSAMPQPQLDDLVYTRGGKAGDKVADLAVG